MKRLFKMFKCNFNLSVIELGLVHESLVTFCNISMHQGKVSSVRYWNPWAFQLPVHREINHVSRAGGSFPAGPSGKESACQCRRCKRLGFDSWVKKTPCTRKWQPTPVFLPEKYNWQRSLVSYNPGSRKELDMTEDTQNVKSRCLLPSLLIEFSFSEGTILTRLFCILIFNPRIEVYMCLCCSLFLHK